MDQNPDSFFPKFIVRFHAGAFRDTFRDGHWKPMVRCGRASYQATNRLLCGIADSDRLRGSSFPHTGTYLPFHTILSPVDVRFAKNIRHDVLARGERYPFFCGIFNSSPASDFFRGDISSCKQDTPCSREDWEDFGAASALNGIGSAIGSLAAGFVFISIFGISGSVRITACINMMIGFGLLLFVPYFGKLKFAAIAGLLSIGIVMSVIIPRWDKLSMSQFLLNPRQKLPDLLDLLYYNEDASA